MKDIFSIDETAIKGLIIITPQRFSDLRGELTVLYNKQVFKDLLGLEFVQDKWTKSSRGVLRGIHFQDQHPQDKLVSVLSGKVLDVVVDIRKSSPTFGQYFSMVLNESEEKMLFIPKGLGHAFLALEDDTVFFYKTSDYFYPEYDRGIIWDDENLKIDWGLNKYNINKPILSKRDLKLPSFEQYIKEIK